MSFWSKFGRLFTVDDSIMDEDFSLLDDGQENHDQFMKDIDESNRQTGAPSRGNPADNAASGDHNGKQRDGSHAQKLKTVKPKKLIPPKKRIPYYEIHKRHGPQGSDSKHEPPVPEKLSNDLQVNRSIVKRIFHLPTNADVIIRDFAISPSLMPIRASSSAIPNRSQGIRNQATRDIASMPV